MTDFWKNYISTLTDTQLQSGKSKIEEYPHWRSFSEIFEGNPSFLKRYLLSLHWQYQRILSIELLGFDPVKHGNPPKF